MIWWLFFKDQFSIYYIKSFNFVTLCDLVTVFAKTKSRLHCTEMNQQPRYVLFRFQNKGPCHRLLGLARSQSYLKFTENNKVVVVSCQSKFIVLGLKTDHSATSRYKNSNLINFNYLELGDTQWYVLTSWWFASWNSKGNAIKGTPRIIHDLQNFRRLFRPRGSPLKVAWFQKVFWLWCHCQQKVPNCCP